MELSLEEAVRYLEADKKLVVGGVWGPKENREARSPILTYECRVQIEQALPRGLKFRISMFPLFPDSATFQLECDQPGQRTCITLYRLDWRPPSAHSNGIAESTPASLRGLSFLPRETHEHICTDNVTTGELRIIKPRVQAARRVTPDPISYDEALAYVCGKLKIINERDIPPSNAQWGLI